MGGAGHDAHGGIRAAWVCSQGPRPAMRDSACSVRPAPTTPDRAGSQRQSPKCTDHGRAHAHDHDRGSAFRALPRS
eukprot:scaffold42350_cov28-Phaeocystis_antarctica.AAC.1